MDYKIKKIAAVVDGLLERIPDDPSPWYKGQIESLNRVKALLQDTFPELKESEDERIRKEIINFLRSPFVTENITDEKIAPWVTYLEKHKEQNEELVYRLNGLMQEYINESKDEVEQAHRFRCYKLFWNALEDTSYFDEPKEQPTDAKTERVIKAARRVDKRC